NAGGDRRGEGSHAPDHRGNDANTADTEAVEQQAGRQLEQHVSPVVGAREPAKGDCRNSEGGLKGVAGDGKIHAVEIVDQNSDAKEEGDAPSPARNFVGEWGS